MLAFKGAPLVFAIDQTRVANHARGLTADRYGQKSVPPFAVVIDRRGKIAFHSEIATGDGNIGRRTAVVDEFRRRDRRASERTDRAGGRLKRSSGF